MYSSDDDEDDEAPPMLVEANPPPPPQRNEVSQVAEANSDKDNNDSNKSHDDDDEAELPPPKPVPVTILTGFLGAGKTTLLNRLLRGAHGRRIAVVENEFGSGLDIESLIARDGLEDKIAGDEDSALTRLVELSNGCICCSVKDGLVAAMEELVRRHHPEPKKRSSSSSSSSNNSYSRSSR